MLLKEESLTSKYLTRSLPNSTIMRKHRDASPHSDFSTDFGQIGAKNWDKSSSEESAPSSDGSESSQQNPVESESPSILKAPRTDWSSTGKPDAKEHNQDAASSSQGSQKSVNRTPSHITCTDADTLSAHQT